MTSNLYESEIESFSSDQENKHDVEKLQIDQKNADKQLDYSQSIDLDDLEQCLDASSSIGLRKTACEIEKIEFQEFSQKQIEQYDQITNKQSLQNSSEQKKSNFLETQYNQNKIITQEQHYLKNQSPGKQNSNLAPPLNLQDYESEDQRYIILMDMDAYYAQVEMKKHNLDDSKCVAVQQWNSIIALSYAAKACGVKRSMNVYDALDVCPQLILVHVSTFEVRDYSDQIEHQKQQIIDSNTKKDMTDINDDESDIQESESSDEETIGKLIPSSISKVKKLSDDKKLDANRRWWVQMRKKDSQKVSLKLYRHESKKIFKIAKRFADPFEKASCDECYLDVTTEVNSRFKLDKRTSYDNKWLCAKFMGFPKFQQNQVNSTQQQCCSGRFNPVTIEEIKLYLATEIAFEVRATIKRELGYNASAGISLNKTVAKIACADNKPNGMTVVPRRYFKPALAQVPIKSIRWLGGKLGNRLIEEGLQTMGDIQDIDIKDLESTIGPAQANWIKNLSQGICTEEIKDKSMPKSASAYKTVTLVSTFEQVLKLVSLCCSDVVDKLKEYIREKDVFPIGILLYCGPVSFYQNRRDIKEKVFSKRVKMVDYEEFKSNYHSLEAYVRKIFTEERSNLPLPLRQLSVTVYNFKPIKELKRFKKLDTVFQQVSNVDDLEAFQKRKEQEQNSLNQSIKQNKARRLQEIEDQEKIKNQKEIEKIKEKENSSAKLQTKRTGKNMIKPDIKDCKSLKAFFAPKQQTDKN